MSEHKSKFMPIYDDTIEVLFFSLEIQSNNLTAWENLCDNINEMLKLLTKDYLWHREDMKVYVSIDKDIHNSPIHLKSTTCFGDNIEDEWFIVYLVKEISKHYEDLIIQLADSDGEFILIESANYLPTWANPESTENRVYLYKQHVHLIPPTMVDVKVKLKPIDAIKLIAQYPEETKVSPEIENSIFSRVNQYPQKFMENFHTAIVKVPLDLAALLTLKPTFVSAFVDAYCNHDMIDLKNWRKLKYENTVLIKVKFTKCLYAMLMHARVTRDIKNLSVDNDKKSDLGLKLTCGFDVFNKRVTKNEVCTKEFNRYISNLKGNGYFQGYIEHSEEYQKLVDKAKNYFLNTKSPLSNSLSSNISHLMSSSEFLNVRESLKNRFISPEMLEEDSDEWLSINPCELNEYLKKEYSQQFSLNKDEPMTAQNITSKLTNFFKEPSDFEGVDTRNLNDLHTEHIDFNPDDFASCVEKYLNIYSSENNDEIYTSESDIETASDKTDDDDALENELSTKLNSILTKNSKEVLVNLSQSIKEEGSSGPTSNLLKCIGVNKCEILDSDDD